MSYGRIIREAFAKAYAECGNATHALEQVLGKERAEKMQRHSLRARASDLLNNYRTVELIEQHKAEMQARGEPLPHYRERTYRADLRCNETKKDPLAKLDIHDRHFLKISKEIRNITAKLEKRFKSRR